MKYFSGDHHFNHNLIRVACERPFETIDEMNEYMIEAWNSVVQPGDVVYHLGDLAYKVNVGIDIDILMGRLKGQKILILGNHDEKNNMKPHFKHFVKVVHIEYIKLSSGDKVMLCHYPMRTWRASHFDSFHLHGHSHGKCEPKGKMLDVGVDNIGYVPVSEEWIVDYMKDMPSNVNYISKEERCQRHEDYIATKSY